MVFVDCVLDAKAEVGEGAVWCPLEHCLWWCDIPVGDIHRFDPASGRDTIFHLPAPVGCFALRSGGGLVVPLGSGLYGFDLVHGLSELWHDYEPNRPGHRSNDGTTDRVGRFWFGTMSIAGPSLVPEGSLYRVDRQRIAVPVLDGLHTQNGLAFSPDGRKMYLSDSYPPVRSIWSFDYDPDDGVATNRQLFFDTRAVAGRPDGATVDADGCYWMAGVGGWQLVRLTPAGRVDLIVPLPIERPSKLAFGGPNLDVIYVTSISTGLTPGTAQPQAGGVFALHVPGITGLPTAPFAW